MEMALSFNEIQFDIIDRENRPWLRLYHIGSALGYEKPEVSVSQLYARHADEFTDTMTALVKFCQAKAANRKQGYFLCVAATCLPCLPAPQLPKPFASGFWMCWTGWRKRRVDSPPPILTSPPISNAHSAHWSRQRWTHCRKTTRDFTRKSGAGSTTISALPDMPSCRNRT